MIIINGDCRDVLKTLPDESVHTCVTSPPYWGLRDYQVDGQIGLEKTIDEYVSEMVEVFREVRRVLRSDGTLWLNLGDSYASGGRTTWNASDNKGQDVLNGMPRPAQPDGLKPKDLCGIPWRVAFALQADGWYLRQDIIWAKPNPMPESVADRCTKSHEYIFLLTKSARYFYDAEAVKEEGVSERERGRPNGSPTFGKFGHNTSCGTSDSATRNKRSVWNVATAPFSEAHFATFPPALIEPCIKAGTSERGCCAQCGAPWEREISRGVTSRQVDPSDLDRYGTGETGVHRKVGSAYQKWLNENPKQTTGFRPTCKCDASAVPCTVLDPFCGAGTTGLVADRLQRNSILIELNPKYATMAENRISGDAPLFGVLA